MPYPFNHQVFEPKTSRFWSGIRGTATLEDDSISIIGQPELSTKQLGLTIRVLSEDSPQYGDLAWKGVIGFRKADPERGLGDDWWIEINVPSLAHHKLVENTKEGCLTSLNLAMKSDLWASSEVLPLTRVIWYLEPKRDQWPPKRTSCVVTNLGWRHDGSSRIKKIAEPLTAVATGSAPDAHLAGVEVLLKNLTTAVHIAIGLLAMLVFGIVLK